MIGKAIFNRAPLTPNRLSPLPLGAVTPDGWLKSEVEAQAEALSEAIRDGRALDANALEAALSAGWVLDREDLKDFAGREIEKLFDAQRPDGSFGDWDAGDWMPRIALLSPIRQYFTATGDKRALVFTDKFLRFLLANIEEFPLRDLACARGADGIYAAIWLYNLTGQKHLLTLAQKIRVQTLDWTDFFHVFPAFRAMEKQRAWAELRAGCAREEGLAGRDQPYYSREYHFSRGDNVAAGLRAPGIVNLLKSGFKELTAFNVGMEKLKRHHGVASGMFSCDDHLNGANPCQGSMTDAVAELLKTVEILLAAGDGMDPELSDLMEKLAFNALPAAYGPNLKTRQNLQQVNQIAACAGPHPFYNEGEDGNVFRAGALPEGFARFAAHAWYATGDEGLYCASYAPCQVNFLAGGTRVRVRAETAYPYDGGISLRVSVKKPADFPIYLRVPCWAESANFRLPDGEIMQMRAGELACVRRRWNGEEQIHVDLPLIPRYSAWFHQSRCVELGPLLMCLRPEEIARTNAAGDTEFRAGGAWNLALMREAPMKAVFYPENAGAFKSGADAAQVLVKAVPAPEWAASACDLKQMPIDPEYEIGTERVVALTPYGNSSVRIAQFPTVDAQ